MRVLAADDDESITSVLERSLRSWGYEAIVAHDGLEAWRILKREDRPQLVVLDWDMPCLSGLEICKMLRGAPRGEEVYVLMLTGRQDKGDLIEALEAGADDFLSKPFHLRELQLRLAKGVTSQSQRASRAASSSAATPPSGTTLGGKYRLEMQINEGGMASVWLGVHLSLGINVAIKFMKPNLADKPDYASFEREARAAAQLRSEHIVRVYDHGIAFDGTPYLVMEYLAGESLADRIDRLGALPIHDVVTMTEQVGRALTEAHGRGIIHRDIKPENILLVDDPETGHSVAKLVDFGLAKYRPTNEETVQSGLISGTPAFMSPEHIRAEVPPNPALDLWGLATTTFTALTGRVPFEGPSLVDVMQSICSGTLPNPTTVNPSLPVEVDPWFLKACARNPVDRYRNAAELSSALGDACRNTRRSPLRTTFTSGAHRRSIDPTQIETGEPFATDVDIVDTTH